VSSDAVPLPGTVVVQVSNMSSVDPGDIELAIDGGVPVVSAAGDETRFESVAAGQHVVSLGGLRPDCTLAGAASQTVLLPSAGTVVVHYEVSCSTAEPGEAIGGVRVIVGSTGWPIDPDGYRVKV